MLFAPPGSAKTTFVSLLFPAWLLQHWPGAQIIGASHTSTLAEDFSGKLQGLIREHGRILGYGLATENRERWYTTNGGAYLAAGVGAAIAGFRADIAIIDDPIKSRADANSEARRKAIWDWYNGDLERRLKPDAAIVLMHTRWHEDDLAGRLLDAERDRWRVVTLPAEAEEFDQLGRRPGEFLWADDAYGYGATLRQIRDDLTARGAAGEWWSQYQQSPRRPDGAIFKIAKIGYLDADEVPAGGETVRGWDLAATGQSATSRDPDWTCGVRLQRTSDGGYIVHDVARKRGEPDVVEDLIAETAGRDGYSVKIGLPQDVGQAGKVQVFALARRLAGYQIESSPESGKKETRAGGVAAQANHGNLKLVRAAWNAAFLDELGAFPTGRHDDQVDALSRAFGMLVTPMESEGIFDLYRRRAAEIAARRAAENNRAEAQ